MSEPTTPPAHAGVHYMAEFWGAEVVTDPERLEALLHEAAGAARSTVVRQAMHAFTPQGLTGFVLLAESHLSFHTWPERDYVAVDIFTCGGTADGRAAIDYLAQVLKPERVEVKRVERGLPPGGNQ